MKKKVIFYLITALTLIIIAGGFFWWWQNQKDVRELNKNLPEGVRVVKNFAREYKVVNKIDGYEFSVPKEWGGIKEIEYIPERTVKELVVTSIGIEGRKGEARDIAIDRYKLQDKSIELESWAKELFNVLNLSGKFNKDTIREIEIIKTQEQEHLMGMHIYFLKKNTIVYVISGGSEKLIRDIITAGRW